VPRPSRHPKKHARVLSFVDREAIGDLLTRLVPDEDDREFVVRCLLDEGPAHHRGANFVLLRLLGLLLGAAPEPSGDSRAAPMHLPPHLAGDDEGSEEQTYPLRLPLSPLDRLAERGSAEQEAMIEALVDGPPQHALANVAIVALVDALLRARDGRS
jgi:hypothetical protein